jgi:hypothetical protein
LSQTNIGHTKYSENFLKIRALSWNDIYKVCSQLESQWVFRGHSETNWTLSSSLERLFFRCGTPYHLISTFEQEMIRQFQRSAHLYLSNLPSNENVTEWLALMQHYGAPTRLLDFTHSFYFASYFACEEVTEDAAVWCLNLKRIFNNIGLFDQIVSNEIKFETTYPYHIMPDYLKNRKTPGLVVIEPEIQNERLHLQQGLFLCPRDFAISFMEELSYMTNISRDEFIDVNSDSIAVFDHQLPNLEDYDVLKIEIDKMVQKQVLNELKKMNVSSATLFPGLDGFSRSLKIYAIPSLDVFNYLAEKNFPWKK